MIELLLNPPVPSSYPDFFSSLLTVSGILFGLTFAGLIFILQSGFGSFTYSRRMILLIYLHFGRQLLYSLAYLTFMPFIFLFFPIKLGFISGVYWVFLVLFLHATLDYAKEEGHLITLNTNRFVPRRYGRVRSYFRLIRNRGFLRNIFHLLPLLFILIYPFFLSIAEHNSLKLTSRAVFYSCILILLFCLLRITAFIPEFFRYQDMELKLDLPKETEDNKETQESNLRLKQALRAHMRDRQVRELDGEIPVEFLDGELSLHFLDRSANDEAFFNAFVKIKNEPPDVVREALLQYAFHLFRILNESRIELNKFVLSFHIEIAGGNSRNFFIRTTRKELDDLFESPGAEPKRILEFKNLFIDELFKP